MSTEGAFKACIKLRYASEEEARAIYDAVLPDNERLPPGLRMRTSVSGRELIIEVSCSKGLESLWATLDDLLSCIQVAERALNVISRAQPDGGTILCRGCSVLRSCP